jgi:hypothetical protein
MREKFRRPFTKLNSSPLIRFKAGGSRFSG